MRRLVLVLVPLALVGCGVPAPGAPDAAGADAAVERCAEPVPDGTSFLGQVTSDEGVAWVWTEHHYVSRQGVIVGSEIVHDVVLPGSDRALVGDPDQVSLLLLDGAGLTTLEGIAALPWAGTARRGVLRAGDRAYLVGPDLAPVPFATLPVAPASYYTLDVGGEVPPLAALADDAVVWLAADGTIRATTLAGGATRTLAGPTSGAREVAAAGRFVAWRDEARVTIADLTGARAPLSVTLTSPRTAALAATPGAILIGDGEVVRRVDPLGGGERVLEVPRVAAGEVIHALAADACGAVVLTAQGSLRSLPLPP